MVGKVCHNTKVVSYRRAFAEALLELGEKLNDLVVLDAGATRSTDSTIRLVEGRCLVLGNLRLGIR